MPDDFSCHGMSAEAQWVNLLSGSTLALAIPKLMSGLGTSVKKCPNYKMNQITKKSTSKLVSIQSLKTFT
jgi:hypothetical protein